MLENFGQNIWKFGEKNRVRFGPKNGSYQMTQHLPDNLPPNNFTPFTSVFKYCAQNLFRPKYWHIFGPFYGRLQ